LASAIACAPTPSGDASSDAAGASADGGGRLEAGTDAPLEHGRTRADEPGYEPWWYDECTKTDGTCDEHACFRNAIVAGATACGPFSSFTVGCVPKTVVLAGWFCTSRISNGQLIFTQVAPMPADGFGPCPPMPNGNLPPPEGKDLCADGGAG
jgi:hypothetical protein